MIGAAHVASTAQIHAARADLFAAQGFARFEMPEHPMLDLETATALPAVSLLDWARECPEGETHV